MTAAGTEYPPVKSGQEGEFGEPGTTGRGVYEQGAGFLVGAGGCKKRAVADRLPLAGLQHAGVEGAFFQDDEDIGHCTGCGSGAGLETTLFDALGQLELGGGVSEENFQQIRDLSITGGIEAMQLGKTVAHGLFFAKESHLRQSWVEGFGIGDPGTTNQSGQAQCGDDP